MCKRSNTVPSHRLTTACAGYVGGTFFSNCGGLSTSVPTEGFSGTDGRTLASATGISGAAGGLRGSSRGGGASLIKAIRSDGATLRRAAGGAGGAADFGRTGRARGHNFAGSLPDGGHPARDGVLFEGMGIPPGENVAGQITAGRFEDFRDDNTTVVAYINKQGGTISLSLCLEAEALISLVFYHGHFIRARHLPGRNNVLADALSRPARIIGTEWTP